jgi:phage shock protein C
MKRYLRSRTSNVIGGVCGGLGDYTGIDPVFWRLAFLLGAFATNVSGIAVWIYIILWAISSKEPKQA